MYNARNVQTTLQGALRAAGNCQAEYEQAPPHIRRWINQGFFKKLCIGPDGSVERYKLTEPFATLLTAGQAVTLASQQAHATATAQIVPTVRTNTGTVGNAPDPLRPSTVLLATLGSGNGSAHEKHKIHTAGVDLDDHFSGHGLNKRYVVALRGPNLNPALVRYIRKQAGQA